MMEFHHTSVLLQECIKGLNIQSTGVYVDGTMGGAGHSKEIIKKLTTGVLVAIDQDQDAIAVGTQALQNYANKILVQDSFFHIKDILQRLQLDAIQGALLDLGVSSYQLDTADRGFSYQKDAPLDMRMDREQLLSAHQIVNEYSQKDLEDIIFTFGEERWARRIAAFIIEERKDGPIQTTGQLVDVIKKAIPKAKRKDGPHPAKRTFQAIRIAVNHELEYLEQAVRDFAEALSPGGRLCIITFHSLEDRIVKNTFRALADPCTCPRDFPVCMCGLKPLIKIVTKKPILPTALELEQNPRARSAKLRIAEKI